MASNESCFMVTWTIFISHLFEAGVTQDRELMALWTLTTVGLFMCEDRYKHPFIEIAFGQGPNHIWLHITFEGLWPRYMILEVCWDGLWTLLFGLSQLHGHGTWLICEVALSYTWTNWVLKKNNQLKFFKTSRKLITPSFERNLEEFVPRTNKGNPKDDNM